MASHTITAADWEKLKTNDQDKVNSLIDVFSDIVFEKVINGVTYLEYKTKDDIKTFYCEEEKIIMNGLAVGGESQLDLSANEDPKLMMQKLQASGVPLRLYTAEKAYKPTRAQEIFRMLEGGALISKDGYLFKTLEGLKSQ